MGMEFQGPLPRSLLPTKTKTEEAEAKPRTSQAKTSTSKDKGTSRSKDKARQGKPRQAQAKLKLQTSRGNLHLSESDWGGFLLKFDLGPHVASLVMSASLSVKLFMCGEGGAQDSG